MTVAACDACIRRSWLLARLSGYLDFQRERIEVVLALDDQLLIDGWTAVAERRGLDTELARVYQQFGGRQARAERERATASGLEQICVCCDSYPRRLRRLQAPPALLHVAGGLERFLELADADPVAIVGTRRPTPYGADAARRLARGVSVSGLSVVSGLAMGVDTAAHQGALAGGGRTVAVLAGAADQPYPKGNRQLHRQILEVGAVISELSVGAATRKWSLVARNRIVAALAEMTVVVQGRARSGALRTAEFTRDLGSRLGAVPGSVLAPQSDGPHRLLRDGATLIRDAQDVLDAICGVGERALVQEGPAGVSAAQRRLLAAIREGSDTVSELGRSQPDAAALVEMLAELELAGCVRRVAGGRYVVSA